MKFLYYILFLLYTAFESCSDAPRQIKQHQSTADNKPIFKKKPGAGFSDTLTINDAAAVFYGPDSLQLRKIKILTDTAVFEGSMHEYFFLRRNAHIVIKKNMPALKIIETGNIRYLLFIQADKNRYCIDLDTKPDAYGLFIFDAQHPPHTVDLANIDTGLGFYFSQ